MSTIIIYPHRLFDLDVREIRHILGNTSALAMDVIEQNIGELIAELERIADKSISQGTKDAALDEVAKFTELLEWWFDRKIEYDKWKYTKDRLTKGYMKALNLENSLVFANVQNGRGNVISLPLYEAIAETMVRIFDYSISKSPEMKYLISKSDDKDRERILAIKSKASVKYYFIRVLRQYAPDTDKGLIRNMPYVFGQNESKANFAMKNLPPTYRK